MDEKSSDRIKVTPIQTVLLGAAVLAGGAFLTGSAHWASTAKKLEEEGIPARARVRAVPLAARALGMSTLFVVAMGGTALAVWRFAGLDVKTVTEVGSVADVIALVKQQREVVKKEIRSSILKNEEGD